MCLVEIERFAADLKSNETLRAEAEKAKADMSMVAFAVSKGYGFTADEAKEYAKARKLADAELDGVAGGVAGPDPQYEDAIPVGQHDQPLMIVPKTHTKSG